MSNTAVIHAYRNLYRQSLRAIRFSKPARYTLRDRIRLAFRKGSAEDFEPHKVQNTLEFLQYATKQNGLEHKILKNLLFVWWVQDSGGRSRSRQRNASQEELAIKTTAYDTFNHNVRMLNESMDLCLPAMTVRDPL
ncbi:hypothetical protein IAQ61_003744 [Plenodomus lingam]|uniref:Uncharacterized protein n=1 Tax=Leptosphaeria maculans (strain JN3 / isolate v23.1.3 / race Av1-4-5-6-7-8) TaxID=985895 RepID=E4ZRM0_LEPMJ|nr:hypothetical protein LEMA_P035410.1 [Plenodomus lingam JN3]KAH9874555.1 hypothetical protein IAQ61_003744 [Plenodomus lingam]CBX93867.1 hypothetical protein LEMA_P035410.1 [Plenodomus lingam JN3]